MSQVVKTDGRERRYKILNLPEHFVVNMFITDALRPGDCYTRHRLFNDEFPEGIEVVHTTYSHMYMAWSLILWHPSWPIIGNGEIPPLLQGGMKCETFVFGKETEITKSWRHLPSQL